MDIIEITEAAEIDDAKVEKEVLEAKKDNAEVEKDDDAKANREVKIQFNQADNQEASQMIFDFAIKTHEQMKQLSLNIIQSPRKIILKTEHQIYNILPSNKIIAENMTNILTQNILLKKPHDLSKSSIKMTLQYHQLLLNLDKLSVPVPIMNPSKYNYIQVLFRKLKKDVELDDDDFLYLPNQLDDDKSGDGDKSEDQPDDDKSEVVIFKIDLLRNEDDLYFNFNKEKAIKILSHQIVRRIESLIKVANDNWGIIDAFPNVDINLFKLTSINVNNYEQWLNFVETGKTISEEEGKMIYLMKKKQENQSRKNELKNIYHQANITDSSDILSNINWGDE
ncbi:hypothetical protein GLOIN_2v1790357 [Rhizophagus clarus]|uniref:Uncharacterized protein n=1 Tax=Rhizophagus clarus TaxID=94130 RepID=A0A8H3M958_9GLOM|nr:hypothetical protein GLOIN_2v1790357 [Rhizophagus clarus]